MNNLGDRDSRVLGTQNIRISKTDQDNLKVAVK